MRSRRLSAVVVLGVGVAVLVGCSTSSASAARKVVLGTSQKTFTGGSARVTIEYSFSGPVTADVATTTGETFRGDGGVDFQRRTSQVTMAVPPGLVGGGSIQTLTDGPSTLVNVRQVAQKVPNAKPWVRSNPTDPAQHRVFGVLNQFLWLLDPVVAVESLNGGDTDVTKVGDEVIRRVATTHYRLRLDLTRAVGALGVSERGRYQQAISGLPDTNVAVEVWVDPQGRLARLLAKATLGGNGGSVSVVLEFYEYGVPVTVTPPPPDQVSEPADLDPKPQEEGACGLLASDEINSVLRLPVGTGVSSGGTGRSDFCKWSLPGTARTNGQALSVRGIEPGEAHVDLDTQADTEYCRIGRLTPGLGDGYLFSASDNFRVVCVVAGSASFSLSRYDVAATDPAGPEHDQQLLELARRVAPRLWRDTVGPDGFLSPSKNIGCALTQSGVRCEIKEQEWQPPPKPSDCLLDWGQAVVVSVQGSGSFLCHGDTAIGGTTEVLPFGSVARRGPFECRSRESGIECVNMDTGHGIALAREEYKVF